MNPSLFRGWNMKILTCRWYTFLSTKMDIFHISDLTTWAKQRQTGWFWGRILLLKLLSDLDILDHLTICGAVAFFLRSSTSWKDFLGKFSISWGHFFLVFTVSIDIWVSIWFGDDFWPLTITSKYPLKCRVMQGDLAYSCFLFCFWRPQSEPLRYGSSRGLPSSQYRLKPRTSCSP